MNYPRRFGEKRFPPLDFNENNQIQDQYGRYRSFGPSCGLTIDTSGSEMLESRNVVSPVFSKESHSTSQVPPQFNATENTRDLFMTNEQRNFVMETMKAAFSNNDLDKVPIDFKFFSCVFCDSVVSYPSQMKNHLYDRHYDKIASLSISFTTINNHSNIQQVEPLKHFSGIENRNAVERPSMIFNEKQAEMGKIKLTQDTSISPIFPIPATRSSCSFAGSHKQITPAPQPSTDAITNRYVPIKPANSSRTTNSQYYTESGNNSCPFTCHVCSKKIFSPSLIRKHIEDNHKFYCIQCERGFSSINKYVMQHAGICTDKIVEIKASDPLKMTVCYLMPPTTSDSRGNRMNVVICHKERHGNTQDCVIEMAPPANSMSSTQVSFQLEYGIVPVGLLDFIICNQCGHYFTKPYYYLQHMKSTHFSNEIPPFDEIHECSLCGKGFEIFQRHVEFYHLKSFMCNFCGKEFIQSKALVEHLQSSHTQSFECKFCGTEFLVKNLLLEHIRKYHAEINLFCPICKKTLPPSTDVEGHNLRLHSDSYMKCIQCFRVILKANILEHLTNEHVNSLTKIDIITPTSQIQLTRVDDDIPAVSQTLTPADHSSTNVLSLPLPETTKTTATKINEQEEQKRSFDMNIMSEVKPTKYSQQEEDGTKLIFSSESTDVSLPTDSPPKKRYKNSNDNNKRWLRWSDSYNVPSNLDGNGNVEKRTCGVCSKSFTRSFDLKRHIKMVHGKCAFQCEQCGKNLKNKEFLVRHLKSSHNIDTTCEACSESFVNIGALTLHKKLYHKKKRHRCELCQVYFKDKETLEKHSKKPHKFTELKCLFCHKRVKSFELAAHVQKLHPEECD